MDDATRETHRQLDGKIVEFDEYFVSGMKKALYPSQFGDPAEDCNCRCNALHRSRSKMNADELKVLKERAEFFGLDKTEDFKEFEKKYIEASKSIENSENYGIINSVEMFSADSDARKDFAFISDERFNSLTITAKKNGATIMRGTEEVNRHLDAMGASASTLGDIILFRDKVCVSEVLEETHHFMQNMSAFNDDKPEPLRTYLNEIDAKEYVLRAAKQYKVPRNEQDHIRKQLENYKKLLAEYYEGV